MSETRDIVEEVKWLAEHNGDGDNSTRICNEAADLITRLRTENATLKAECDMLRREASREASLAFKVERLFDEHRHYTKENRALDEAARKEPTRD